MTDSIKVEIAEIAQLLTDDRLSHSDRFALYGARQALRNVLEPDKWQTATTMLRVRARNIKKAIHQ